MIVNDTHALVRRPNIEIFVTNVSRYSGIAAFALSLVGIGYLLLETLG